MDYQMEELLPIVSELAQKYAGYESTSITYEKAQSLMIPYRKVSRSF